MTSAIEPVLLRADNFTPPSRTPWGGRRLARDYKQHWLHGARDLVVGESWEVSVEPDFPARLEDGSLLTEFIGHDPAAVLGEEHRRGRVGTALLVKLIDTAEPLSVQIHPSDDYAGLATGECGKPESWYVVAREPGAGLYLGFEPGTSEADVRAALERGQGALRELLRFVPVEPGDFFVIDAGTPHAIGEGLTLVEPQHVMPGLRGVTYRYWDWDRRYDAQGRAAPDGSLRPLHVDHALAVTAWQRVQEPAFVGEIRRQAGPAEVHGKASLTPLAGDGGLNSQWLRVGRLAGTGVLNLPASERLLGITVLEGKVRLGSTTAERGRSMVVPACLGDALVELSQAHAIVSSVE
ncbi:MAG: class I mannose-6-phosphate isomerase [Myxococcales bacterium]